jgi:hypothetical protein
MEVTNSRGYADLQAVMAMARQRNAALGRPNESQVSTAQKTASTQNTARMSKGIADTSVQSGKLVERFYANTAKKQEQSLIRIGSRFDAYA